MGEAHRPFRFMSQSMLTLYSYPPLFGAADAAMARGLAVKQSLAAHDNIARHCRDIHEAVGR